MIDTYTLRRFARSTADKVLGAEAAKAADHIDAQAAEIAEARIQIEHLDRQNNALREALRPLAEIDLTEPPPNDFAWFVLRARAALSGEGK